MYLAEYLCTKVLGLSLIIKLKYSLVYTHTLQWCFGKEPLLVAQGTHKSVIESIQPEHKTRKRSQPEITIQYLNIINHYVDTKGLSTESGITKY